MGQEKINLVLSVYPSDLNSTEDHNDEYTEPGYQASHWKTQVTQVSRRGRSKALTRRRNKRKDWSERLGQHVETLILLAGKRSGLGWVVHLGGEEREYIFKFFIQDKHMLTQKFYQFFFFITKQRRNSFSKCFVYLLIWEACVAGQNDLRD